MLDKSKPSIDEVLLREHLRCRNCESIAGPKRPRLLDQFRYALRPMLPRQVFLEVIQPRPHLIPLRTTRCGTPVYDPILLATMRCPHMPQAIMLEVEPLFAVWTCNPLILVFIAMAEVARGC